MERTLVVFVVATIALAAADLLGQYKFLDTRSGNARGGLTQRKCYKIVDYLSTNWHGANVHCNSIGMRLATIENQEQQDEIERLMSTSPDGKGSLWIGASNLADGKSWVWISTGEPVDYCNWLPGKPDNPKKERCVEQSISKCGWNDRDCDAKQRFVCESVSPRGCACNANVVVAPK